MKRNRSMQAPSNSACIISPVGARSASRFRASSAVTRSRFTRSLSAISGIGSSVSTASATNRFCAFFSLAISASIAPTSGRSAELARMQ